MALISGFDATTVEPSAGFDDLPEGQYVAEIIASEEKKTNSGTGSYLALTWQVSEGPMSKRRIWTNLNLDNPNAEAVNIAKAELSAICRAIGVLKPQDSSELHYKRCRITVKHKRRKDGKGTDARIVKFESMNSVAAAPAGTTTGATPPWQKKA